jgi:uncharacterized protein (TIGR03437 family)
VRINGDLVQLSAASRNHVDFICPAVAPGEPLAISVETEQGRSTPVRTVQLEASPAILPAFSTEETQGMISVRETNRLASVRDHRDAGEPAQAGDAIVIKAAGLGHLDQAGRTLAVNIGGRLAEVESITQDEDAAGVVAIQVRIPVNAPQGDAVPVQLEIKGAAGRILSNNKVTMAIEGPIANR